ncbi:MAG: hypothetical protein ACPIOQ_80280, partial [Promethearchaeia archaeon]
MSPSMLSSSSSSSDLSLLEAHESLTIAARLHVGEKMGNCSAIESLHWNLYRQSTATIIGSRFAQAPQLGFAQDPAQHAL